MKWRTMPFGDFVEVQPTVILERGEEYPFVPMEIVEPHNRDIYGIRMREWDGGGGVRFANGDTIFARITPCLEHGKIAQLADLDRGVGFGSTEFFVFRKREGVSDADFIYYMACSEIIRQPAIKSMVGASGRQRAQRVVVEQISVRVPPVDIQESIAQFLSNYDDLLKNNRRRIELLEEAAQLLYREWFVHLRFPGHEHIRVVKDVPEGWKKGKAFDAMEVLSGGTPKTSMADYWDGEIPFYTPKDSAESCYVLDTEKHLTEVGLENCNSNLYPKDTVFITARGTVGNLNLAQRPMAMNQSCYALVGKEGVLQKYLFCAMRDAIVHFQQNASGAVFDAIIVDTFKRIPFIVPEPKIVSSFESTVEPMFKQVENLLLQNQRLKIARDILLPRLMNGEIQV